MVFVTAVVVVVVTVLVALGGFLGLVVGVAVVFCGGAWRFLIGVDCHEDSIEKI